MRRSLRCARLPSVRVILAGYARLVTMSTSDHSTVKWETVIPMPQQQQSLKIDAEAISDQVWGELSSQPQPRG